MDTMTEAELIALAVIICIAGLKFLLFYYGKKLTDPEIKMNPIYIITGIFAVLVTWATFVPTTTDPIMLIKELIVPTIGLNIMFELPAKFKN